MRLSDFHEFDLIFAADELNISALRRVCPPELQHKIALFLENTPLPDPYYGGASGFEDVLNLVEKRAAEIVEKLVNASGSVGEL